MLAAIVVLVVLVLLVGVASDVRTRRRGGRVSDHIAGDIRQHRLHEKTEAEYERRLTGNDVAGDS